MHAEPEAGAAFFDKLVRYIARAIGTKDQRRLLALSCWVGDRFHGDLEHAIADTPCEPVNQNRRLVHVPDRVLGNLAVLHDEPMLEDARITAIFNRFAALAAAEHHRPRRDRDRRERERKLSRLRALRTPRRPSRSERPRASLDGTDVQEPPPGAPYPHRPPVPGGLRHGRRRQDHS
jgi:hypothetical protein